MTSEVAFAKSFLAVLDAKPVKLQADYATDLATLELDGPYTLPQMPQPMKRPEKSTVPGSEASATILLKSSRNPPLDLSLPTQALSTSMLDLKRRVSQEIGLDGTDKVRLLYNKKPCADSKSIKDILGSETATSIEFSVMIIGGAPQSTGTQPRGSQDALPQDSATVADDRGHEVLGSRQFWEDLRTFLKVKVSDQSVAERAAGIFEEAWKQHNPSS